MVRIFHTCIFHVTVAKQSEPCVGCWLILGAVTLQMLSRTHNTDSPGLMMVSTGWSFGRHTQDGVRWSGTHMSLSVLGRGRLFTVPSSLF